MSFPPSVIKFASVYYRILLVINKALGSLGSTTQKIAWSYVISIQLQTALLLPSLAVLH